ncbi:MAG: glycine cleavage system protein H, partial [Frankiaceae bacterium]|nr:glycine cleavage system protein H [Frankiaceae bacterium]
EIESHKSVSELFAPLSGTVVARNDALEGAPELLNADPYGDGWIVEIEVPDAAAIDGLLDPAAYAALVED